MSRQRWTFAGRMWTPLLGEVLVWELPVPYSPVPLRFIIEPAKFWVGPR
jgi:hypothetical protein